MSGKKKIAYPIELPFTIQEPILLNNAIDKYQLHKELIDQLLNALVKYNLEIGQWCIKTCSDLCLRLIKMLK